MVPRSTLLALAAPLTLAVFLVGPGIEAQSAEGRGASNEAVLIEPLHDAVRVFRQALSPEQNDESTFPLDHPERRAWSNLPSAMFKREGVSFGELSEAQRVLAHQLLQTPLSSQGYLKVSGIMRIDEILKEQSGMGGMFGQDRYWLGFFGDLENGPWGFQLDGHHLALNVTVVGEEISMTPMFKGSEPAEVRAGRDAGWYPLYAEDKGGRALWNALDEKQRSAALLPGGTPRDVVAGPTRADPIAAIEIWGLPHSEMTASQQRLLLKLLGEWVHDLDADLATAEMERIRAGGIDRLHFSWSGVEEGKPYYFRIHGPTILIELDNNYPPGRSGGVVNHIHSVWRDPTRDYGEDLLARHYRESPHHQAEGEPAP